VNPSASLTAIVEADEGFSPTIFMDAGHPCIGFGCDLSAAEVEHYTVIQPISRDAGIDLLLARLVPAASVVNHFVTTSLTQNQFDALCDLVYNIGAGNFQQSTLLRLLNSGNVAGAAEQFGVWIYSAGAISPGLVARRAKDKALFLA
jgi:lysozyme